MVCSGNWNLKESQGKIKTRENEILHFEFRAFWRRKQTGLNTEEGLLGKFLKNVTSTVSHIARYTNSFLSAKRQRI